MYLKKQLFGLPFLFSMLAACGGSNDSPAPEKSPAPVIPPNVDTRVGVFIDSPVANLDYQTNTHSGVTNAKGQFFYEPGESIVFSIGQVDLPSSIAGPVITPMTLVNSSDINSNVVVNIARLLQSMDIDADPSNGITIAQTAKGAATTNLNFSLSITEFAQNNDVLNLIQAGGQAAPVTELVSEASAINHLKDSLDSIMVAENLVGVWKLSKRPDQAIGDSLASYIIMLENGVYYELDAQEINDGDGWEFGRYSYENDELSFTTTVELNSEIGLNGATIKPIFDGQDTFRFETDDPRESGNYEFQRIAVNNSNGLSGLWTFPAAPSDKILFVFADDGSYIALQPYEENNDTGFEIGSYTFEQEMLSISILHDHGSALLADATNSVSFPTTIDGDTITLQIESESVTLSRAQ